MDDKKQTDTEQTEQTGADTVGEISEETTEEALATEATPTTPPVDAEQTALWREGLVQEALSNRPELRKLASKKAFGTSRRIGHELGFEDGARKLTLGQLEALAALKARYLASYTRHEMPADLHGYLEERSVGLDEGGFLAGYVDGVNDFLDAYRAHLRRHG